MMLQTYDKQSLKTLLVNTIPYKSINRLSQELLDGEQQTVFDTCTETILEKINDLDCLNLLTDLMYHFARFGFNPELRAEAAVNLGLIRDSFTAHNDIKLAKKLFFLLSQHALSNPLNQDKSNHQAQEEMFGFLDYTLPDIQTSITIYFLDTKSNGFNNLIKLKKENEKHNKALEFLFQSMITIIKKGPASYPCILKEHGSISSKDILTRLLNQYAYGPIGVIDTDQLYPLKTYVRKGIEILASYPYDIPDGLKPDQKQLIETYHRNIHSSASKCLLKQASLSIKRGKSIQSLENNNNTILDEIGDLIDSLKKIQDSSLQKPIKKVVDELFELSKSFSPK